MDSTTLSASQLLGAAASAGGILDGIFKQAAFSQILLWINLILLAAGTVWLSYNIVAGLVQSAWEGEFLGKRFHSVWMPIRVSVGFAALLPVIGGWSASQYIVYQTAKMGAGAANLSLSAAGAGLIDNTLISAGGGGEKQLALQAFGSLLCAERNRVAAQAAVNNGDGQSLSDMETFYGVSDCGQLQAPPGELQSAHTQAAASMTAALAPWAQAAGRGQEGLQEPPARVELLAALDAAAGAYGTAIRAAAAALAQQKRTALDQAAINQNWLTYGFQTVRAAQAQQDVSRAAGAAAGVQGKGNSSSAGKEAAASVAGLAESAGAATTGGGGSGWDQIMRVKDNPALLFKLAFGNMSSAPSLGQGGLIQSLAAMGSWLIAVAWGAVAFFLGVLAVLALGSFLSAGAIPLALYAGAIVAAVALPLAIMGVTLAVYVPLLPSFLWTLGIVAWLLVVAEGLFLAPVWAFCHLEGEGEGMGQRSEKGYAFMLDLLLRPLLLLGSFAIASGVLNAAWGLFSESLGGVLSLTNSSSVTEFFMWLGMLFLVTTLAVQLVGTVYRKCLDLPDAVASWLGHSAASYTGDHSTKEVEPGRPNLPNLPQRQGGGVPKGGGDAPAAPPGGKA